MTLMLISAAITHTIVAFCTDIRTRRIPNGWNMTAGLLGLGFHLFTGGAAGLLHASTGALVLFGLTFALHACGAIGGGDVKWFAALGAWLGISLSVMIFLYTMVIAGLIGVACLLGRRAWLPQLGQWLRAVYFTVLFKDKAHLATGPRSLTEIPLMIAVVPAVALVCWQMLGGDWR